MLIINNTQKPNNTRFREQGDDVGTVVNILFYSPVTYIMSYSILRIGISPQGQGMVLFSTA